MSSGNTFRFSVEALQQAPTRFFIVLTDCHTGEPVYFHVCDDRVFAALRATASMPLATRGFDYVDGHPFADGGVADPIPIQRALQDGATDITVVLTHNRNFRLKPMPRWLGHFAFPEFPKVALAWTDRQHLVYNAALDLMNQPPPGIRLQVFRPIRPLPVGAFTTAQKRIDAALASGHDEALANSRPAAPAWNCPPRRVPWPSRFLFLASLTRLPTVVHRNHSGIGPVAV